MTGEPDGATPRKAMTPARRLRLWLAADGRCGQCRCKVPLKGTVMDHFITLWMRGPDEDHNLRPLCAPCDKVKTAADAAERAHVKRLRQKNGLDPAPSRQKKKIQGRPFDQGHRPIPSRPFPKREARS